MPRRLFYAFIPLFIYAFVFSRPAHAAWEGSLGVDTLVMLKMIVTNGCPPQTTPDPANPESLHWYDNISLETFLWKCNDQLVGTGLLNISTNSLAALYSHPPASTSEFLADISSRLGAPPAYAQQGLGATQLLPILSLWRAFRNIAYIFYILMFVLVGLMIMFRTKINPQTIVNLQAALPNLILSLLLITFSYAIAGFLIDLMYWTIYFVAFIFEAAGILAPDKASTTLDLLLNLNLSQDGGWREIVGSSAQLIGSVAGNIWFGFGAYWIIGQIVFAVAVLVSMFKTIIELLKAYLIIILHIITAPLQLLTNAVPGSQAFTTWLRCLTGHLAVFPAVAIFLLIGAALVGDAPDRPENRPEFTEGVGYSSTGPSGFVPPFIFRNNDPNLGTGPAIQVIQGLLGLAIMLVLPEVVNIVKERFGCKTPDYGQVIMTTYKEGMGWSQSLNPLSFFRAYNETQSSNPIIKILNAIIRTLKLGQ